MKLIYIGDNFYQESGTLMSSIYTDKGKRSDWGAVQEALSKGENVEIRQATTLEKEPFLKKLAKLKQEQQQRNNYG